MNIKQNMKKATKTLAKIVAVATIAYKMSTCTPPVEKMFEDNQSNTYQVIVSNEHVEPLWTRQDSLVQYAIPVHGTLIQITPENLYVNQRDNTGIWRKYGQGYEHAQHIPSYRNRGAIMYNDTLRQIDPDSVYSAFDGLGYGR